MARRITFAVALSLTVVAFGTVLALPASESSFGSGEIEVTIHLDPRIDPCGSERIEIPDEEFGMWLRQDRAPAEWFGQEPVAGVLTWSDDMAVLVTENGHRLRYRYERGSMSCTWG